MKTVKQLSFLLQRLLPFLIYEKILRWLPPEQKYVKVERENKQWNEKHGQDRCNSCNSGNIVNKKSGSNGLFCSPNEYYQCVECGNNQDERNSYKYLFDALDKNRLTQTGNKYRYKLFTEFQWSIIIILSLIYIIVKIVPWWFDLLRGGVL